jgi:hypothetical protein
VLCVGRSAVKIGSGVPRWWTLDPLVAGRALPSRVTIHGGPYHKSCHVGGDARVPHEHTMVRSWHG